MSATEVTKDGTLRVPGASLYYKVRGMGPVLLILQGGAADAEGFDGVATHLVDHYTVVTYDRRGLSRSTLDGSAEALRLETHSDDAHRLLAALTSAPAFVVGCSISALIGLDLAARHAEQVRTLVAHEPPAPQLLPDAARARAERAQEDAEETYRREGVAGAMKQFMAMTGVNYDDREPDVEWPQPTLQAAANAEFFLAHDAPAVRRYTLDIAALKAASTLIVPAGGRSSREIWTHHCAGALADRLGTEMVEFPGGHAGLASHPTAFAARLRDVLGGSPDTGRTVGLPGSVRPRQAEGFDAPYAGTPPRRAPWDIGRPQPAFLALAEAGALRGRVLDVGCGSGEHVLMAAGLGLEATGVDVAAAAIDVAEGKARDRGLSARFLVWNALQLAALDEQFDTVLDCGLFHLFEDDVRPRFADNLRAVIRPGGRYFMLCFSDRQPGVLGPRRVTQDEIRASFADGWQVDSIEPVTIDITSDPNGALAWLAAITRT